MTINGLPVDVRVVGDYKPEDWRKHPEPADIDKDDDEDVPCPPDVEMVLGFDPDEEVQEAWTDEAREAAVEARKAKSAKWLNSWTFGEEGKSATKAPKPDNEIQQELSHARPSGTLTLYRSHKLGTPAGPFESWTTERGLADTITENSEGRVTLKRQVHPSEMLYHGGLLKHGLGDNVLDNEVVVANGKAAKDMAAVRGEKHERGQLSHGEVVR